MLKQFVAIFLAKLEERLATKTGWGRNEIMSAVRDCVNESLMEMLG